MSIETLELRRRPGRFATAASILTLLAALLMLLGGLLDGLIDGSTGAFRAQRADLVVYSAAADRSLPRSRISDADRAAVDAVPGVEKSAALSVVQLGARVPGKAPRDLAPVALVGYELPPNGVPAVPADGSAFADRILESDGVRVGQTLLVGPARSPVRIQGWVDGLTYAGQGTLWASMGTWRTVTAANRPDAVLGPNESQALLVRADPGVDPSALAARVSRGTDGAVEALTLASAIDAIPGVSEQNSTFSQIIGVTLVIAVLVVALFFALLTIERQPLYGVLKAVGATSGRLFRGVLVQVFVITAIASLIGTSIAVAIDRALPPGSIPFDLRPARAAGNLVFLFLAAFLGGAFSLRRVLRIDPASAIGSSS
ncbi:MAG: ABC transporter permease [Microthrixaceae bacterium]|nr:ABC transporter permease [Microthrixaceae bacterium]MCB9375686.1 ABC transporter permease [Microthrixaceae bacterium]MCB9402286.1 ABC transporter permease [Microthrixaceae bacterium]MCO5306602.1 ABC transporter permease [Microthrixaceae bacterium]